MRVSWTQAAAGALTIVVAAGLSLLPGRLLGPEAAVRSPIELPASTPLEAVIAAPAPPPARTRPVRHVVVRRVVHTAAPAAQLASVVTPAVKPAPAKPVVQRAKPQTAVLGTSAVGHARHLPIPADTPAQTPASAPAPAPAPAPAAPAAAAPAPAAAPAAPTPATTTPTRILADTYVPAATTSHGDEDDQGDDDQGENDDDQGNDTGSGNGKHDNGRGNGNDQGNGHSHGSGRDR